jgi:hypothetical protein
MGFVPSRVGGTAKLEAQSVAGPCPGGATTSEVLDALSVPGSDFGSFGATSLGCAVESASGPEEHAAIAATARLASTARREVDHASNKGMTFD